MTGRLYNEKVGAFACLLVFVGFNVTFFTQFFLGSRGMPRRYYTYLDQFQPLHAFSTYGSWILGAGLFIALGNLLYAVKNGEKAGPNPWGGLTLEWKTASPPPTENFHRTPLVTHGPYDFPSTGSASSKAGH
jgi:cytochrome c oxidase subunit 1